MKPFGQTLRARPLLNGLAFPSNPLRVLDKGVGVVTETLTCALILAEIAMLFAGVAFRYAFHRPIVWTDEMASLLFLWLGMLGAVVAYRRGEHMRMAAFINLASPRVRAVGEAVGTAVVLLFCLLILLPSYDYALDEASITTPALEIASSWRAAALPAGIALMAFTSVFRLWEQEGKLVAFIAVLSVAAAGCALYAVSPMLMSLGQANLLVFFVGVVGLTVLAGIPIAFCFGVSTVSYLALTTSMPMTVVVGRTAEGMSHLMLLAVPLFVFLGLLMEMTGMARVMVRFLANLLGHTRGGLSYVLVGAIYLVSGISGSKAADMAAIAPVLFPEMEKRGAKRGDLVALLAATGAQTETVPPSLVLITLGSVTGISIAALFTAGLMPAAVLGAMLCGVIWMRHRREDLSGIRRASIAEIARSLVAAAPALALPFVIRAAVIEGVATATEVSTIGIVYCVAVGAVVYRRFEWRRLRAILVETASLSGAILLIIGSATGMAWALTQSGFSQSLASIMASLPGGRNTFLAVSVVVFILLGSLLEGIPAIVLFGPLMFPIAQRLGVNEVHYAMVVVIAMGIGLFAPPLGVGYYGACAIGRARPDEGMRSVAGYFMALCVGLALVAAVPWLSIGFLGH